jgi:hypothetical protein
MGNGRNGRLPGRQTARGAGAGAGISLTVHAALGMLIWTGVATSGRLKGVDVGSGEMGSVAVGLIEDILPTAPPPPPPVLQVAPKDQRPQKVVVTSAVRRKIAAVGAQTPRASAVASAVSVPPIEAIKHSSETQTPTPPLSPAPITAPPSDAVAAAGLAPGAPAPAPPSSRAATFVEPEVATYLRSEDYFPALPTSLRKRGAHYQARMDICVSTEGRVVNVGFRENAAPALDSALASAARAWRYRPLMVNGTAAPFCHRMTVSYTM